MKCPSPTDFAIQIESSIFLSFTNFIINGSSSAIDVAGLKIHIYPARAMQSLTDLQNSGAHLTVNFTNCIITRTSSFNSDWSDTHEQHIFRELS